MHYIVMLSEHIKNAPAETGALEKTVSAHALISVCAHGEDNKKGDDYYD